MNPKTTLPIKIEKNLGADPVAVFGSTIGVMLFQSLPYLLTSRSLVDAFARSGAGVIDASLGAFVTIVYFASRKRGELEIDQNGVRVVVKRDVAFYEWADIDHVVETSTGVKLILKGRSDEQNAYNVISSRFGLRSSELYAAITDGVRRFGANRGAGSGRTQAPGDDLRTVRASSLRFVFLLLGLPFGCIFAGIVIWQAMGCLKTLELQKHGRPIEARVVQIYSNGCGRVGCSIYVEYSFRPYRSPNGTQKEYSGYELLTSSSSVNDPDLVYAKTNGTVPIAYDETKPTVSRLNFRNIVFVEDAVKIMLRVIGWLGGMLAVILGLCLAVLMPRFLRWRKSPA